MEVKKHTIKLIVNNRPDVLARIAGVFSGRGFNIESISANTTMDPDITKIRIVTTGDSLTVTKIQNQLKKLVDVESVSHVRASKAGQREMVLIRIRLSDDNRDAALKTIGDLHCQVLSKKIDHCIIEATGTEEDIDTVLAKLEPLGIEDMSRSGIVAL